MDDEAHRRLSSKAQKTQINITKVTDQQIQRNSKQEMTSHIEQDRIRLLPLGKRMEKTIEDKDEGTSSLRRRWSRVSSSEA